MGLMKATKIENKIQEETKKKKFEKMVSIQEKFIKEIMATGRKYVIWIFSDIEYYNNALEKTWFKEFADKAKAMFEEAGYKIKGICIHW